MIDWNAALNDPEPAPPLVEGIAAVSREVLASPEAAPDLPPLIPRAPVPAVTGPLDLAPIKAGLSKYEPDMKAMEDEAGALVVNDDATMARAVGIAGKAKKGFKALELKRKTILAPAAEFTSGVNAIFKHYQGRFSGVEFALKAKMDAHHKAQALARAQAEEAARKAAAAAQAALDAEVKTENDKREAEAAAENARREAESKTTGEAVVKVKAVKVEAIQIPEPVSPEPAKVIQTGAGSLSFRKSWEFKVTDSAQVPREYLAVDEKAIRRAVTDGIRNIPGVTIYEDSKPVVRA